MNNKPTEGRGVSRNDLLKYIGGYLEKYNPDSDVNYDAIANHVADRLQLAEQANAVPVAWLHEVVIGDEGDEALSFQPDYFLLNGVGVLKSFRSRPLYLHPPKDTNPLNHTTQDLYEHWLAVENLYHTEDLRKAFYHGAGEHTPEELAGFRAKGESHEG